jgi:hypothetical protein
MLVVLLLALFWNRRPLIHSAVFQPSTMMHQLYLGALMFMLLSALLWLENTWFVTPLPWTRQTLFCFWSVNRSLFFVSLVFCHHDQNLETQIFQSIAKIAKVTCSSWASVTWAGWWRPGRAETAAAEWGRAWIRSARSPWALFGCSGFADCSLPPLSF